MAVRECKARADLLRAGLLTRSDKRAMARAGKLPSRRTKIHSDPGMQTVISRREEELI